MLLPLQFFLFFNLKMIRKALYLLLERKNVTKMVDALKYFLFFKYLL